MGKNNQLQVGDKVTFHSRESQRYGTGTICAVNDRAGYYQVVSESSQNNGWADVMVWCKKKHVRRTNE